MSYSAPPLLPPHSSAVGPSPRLLTFTALRLSVRSSSSCAIEINWKQKIEQITARPTCSIFFSSLLRPFFAVCRFPGLCADRQRTRHGVPPTSFVFIICHAGRARRGRRQTWVPVRPCWLLFVVIITILLCEALGCPLSVFSHWSRFGIVPSRGFSFRFAAGRTKPFFALSAFLPRRPSSTQNPRHSVTHLWKRVECLPIGLDRRTVAEIRILKICCPKLTHKNNPWNEMHKN